MERMARMQELVERMAEAYGELNKVIATAERAKELLRDIGYEITMLDSEKGEGG